MFEIALFILSLVGGGIISLLIQWRGEKIVNALTARSRKTSRKMYRRIYLEAAKEYPFRIVHEWSLNFFFATGLVLIILQALLLAVNAFGLVPAVVEAFREPTPIYMHVIGVGIIIGASLMFYFGFLRHMYVQIAVPNATKELNGIRSYVQKACNDETFRKYLDVELEIRTIDDLGKALVFAQHSVGFNESPKIIAKILDRLFTADETAQFLMEFI